MARVYVSSTRTDLKEHRRLLLEVLDRMDHKHVAMEHYAAERRPPIERCLADIAACDLFVSIIAWRYGTIPPGYDRSFTELELDQAKACGKECLVYVLDESADWPPRLIEFDAIGAVREFRKRAVEGSLAEYFSNKDELRALLGEAVHQWEDRQGITPTQPSTDWDGYRKAFYEEHRWVRLSVIAGATQDRMARVPLTEVFAAPLTETGRPSYDLPDEVLRAKRAFLGITASEPADTQCADADVDADVPKTESSIDIIGRERNQVILGGPGSGKSTLLHYALLTLCQPEAEAADVPAHLSRKPVPFLVELRQYVLKRAPDFISYIVENARERYGVDLNRDEVEALVNEDGRALVLFDGLDEVFERSERTRAIQQFGSFARTSGASIVVTSRIVGYDQSDLGLAGFQHYTLLNFTIQEIRQFVPAWYRYYTWEGDHRDAAGLLRRITESPRLLDLAGNPLLLTMMAVIYKHQDLPEQRWRLYERCTSVLLEDWDLKRKSIESNALLPLDLPIRGQQKAEILQLVAMYMVAHGQRGRELNAIAYRPLLGILADYMEQKYSRSRGEAEAIADGILQHLRERSSILAEVGEGIFGFVHRTFMEYFAATQCRAEFNARRADYPWLMREVFDSHWESDDWREILLLLVAMLGDQGSPVREVIDHLRTACKRTPRTNVVFAARCLAESGTIEDEAWATQLMAELVTTVTKEAARTKQRVVDGQDLSATLVEEGLLAFSALAPLVAPSAEARSDIARLGENRSRRPRITGWQMELAMRTPDERRAFAIAALTDPEEAVRRGAIAALNREWPGNAEVEDALIAVVRRDRNTRVRQDALETLARAWAPSPELLAAIAERSDQEKAYTFTSWLVRYVGRRWRRQPEALEVILRLAAVSPKVPEYDRWDVAAEAVATIANGWAGDPGALASLGTTASDHPDAHVGNVAMMALATGWPDDESVNDRVQRAVARDTDLEVRSLAVCALHRTRSDESRAILLSLTRDVGTHAALRVLAMVALWDRSREDEALHALLVDEARRDGTPALWRAALQLAAGLGSQDLLPPDVERLGFLPVFPATPFGPAPIPSARALAEHTARDHPDVETRAFSFRVLRQAWDDDDTQALLRNVALEDPHAEIRSAALEVLARPAQWDADAGWMYPSYEDIEFVAKRAFLDPEPATRAAAEEAVAGFRWDLTRTDPLESRRAATVAVLAGLHMWGWDLLEIGASSAVAPQFAAEILRMGRPARRLDTEAIDTLGELLSDPSPWVRATAAVGLAHEAVHREDLRVLISERQVGDTDSEVREVAGAVLDWVGSWGRPEDVPD